MTNRDNNGRILAGNQLSAEEKAKKAMSLSLTWKNDDRYIGDIKDIHPRIYNSWRGIKFTKRGKENGCCEEWSSFRNFYNDVEPTYKKGLVLRRKDMALPWGPDNFMWVNSSVIGDIQARIFIEYNGEKLSLRQWANKLNISFSALKVRYTKREERQYTVEEILFGRKRRRNSKLVKDIGDPNVNIRAKASKMIHSYRIKDIKNGIDVCDFSIDWMINNILTKPCVYCGDTKRIGCDRIDNSKGHTKDNVVPCCIECNTARNNNFSHEEMFVLGETIAKIKEDRSKKDNHRN